MKGDGQVVLVDQVLMLFLRFCCKKLFIVVGRLLVGIGLFYDIPMVLGYKIVK